MTCLTPSCFHVYSDASFKDGISASAAIIVIPGFDSVTVLRESRCGGSNQAEYDAALLGSRWAVYAGAKHVELFTDSEVIVKQFNGTIKTRSEKLLKLRDTLRLTVSEIHHKPKHILVREADLIAKQTLKRALMRKKPCQS